MSILGQMLNQMWYKKDKNVLLRNVPERTSGGIKMLNILFMGTPDFAKESLEAVYNAGYNILGVVTNPDKPKG